MATRALGQQQLTPESVNLRAGDGVQSCGKCMNFDGPASWCRAINMSVDETMLCDLFADAAATEPAGDDLLSQLFGM